MRRLILALAALPMAASAQVAPIPSYDDPRLQTVVYRPGESVRLVAYPGANLTLMFLPGEQVERVVLSEQGAFSVSVVGANDSLNVMPLRPGASASMTLETNQRRYEFTLETGEGLAAAYVVRFVREPSASPSAAPPPADELTGAYKLSGSERVRPARIADDGRRTYIEWGEYQALPAVFGLGPSDEEEVVDGYMRDGVFTIDRVYRELVFRIDQQRAKARRVAEPGAAG